MTHLAPTRGPLSSSSAPRRPCGLAAYLLMPRPKDLVKGALIPTTYVLGLFTAGEVTPASLLRAAVVLIAVELLIYPARYQWNDVRGFVADQQHPSSRDRGRLPGPLGRARPHVFASCAVMIVRLAATGLLVVLLPGLDLGPILGFAVVGVFGVAIVYETLRSMSTGRTGEIPAPLSAGVVLLWLTVGAGYVVRGVTGLALAVDLPARPTLVTAAVVTLWAYGLAFVTSRWALEATAFAASADGWVVWQARAGQAREHLLALVRWLPARIDGQVVDVADWAPLRERTPVSAPWNLAMVVGGGAAALTGRLLCGATPLEHGVTATIVGAAATVAITAGARRRKRFVVIGGIALLGAAVLTNSPRPLLAVAPWLLLMGAYLFFSTRTRRQLGRRNALGVAAAAAGSAIGRLIVGSATWAATRRPGVEAIDTPS